MPEGASREKALRTIDSYARNYPLVPILITSRPGAFDPKDYDNLHNADVHTVDDMSADQRAGFIENWHEARAASRHAVEGIDYASLGEKLVERTENIPPLARIANNPLLCAAICALHENEPQTLPTDERGLCERLTRMLLTRDRAAGRTDPVILKDFGAEYDLPEPKRRQLLAFIAERMVARGRSQERLYLSKTPVSDLSPLSGLTALEVLHLNETPVKDVSPLRGLKELKILWLHDTSVTDLSPLDGIRRLEVIGNDSRPEKQPEKALRQQ